MGGSRWDTNAQARLSTWRPWDGTNTQKPLSFRVLTLLHFILKGGHTRSLQWFSLSPGGGRGSQGREGPGTHRGVKPWLVRDWAGSGAGQEGLSHSQRRSQGFGEHQVPSPGPWACQALPGDHALGWNL